MPGSLAKLLGICVAWKLAPWVAQEDEHPNRADVAQMFGVFAGVDQDGPRFRGLDVLFVCCQHSAGDGRSWARDGG